MTADVDTFRSLYPQFSSSTFYPDAKVEQWFDAAAARFTLSRFGAQAAQAVYLFAAHSLTLFPPSTATADTSDQGSAKGAVTSERSGDLARSYATTTRPEDVPSGLRPFLATSYGVELVGIIMSRSRARGRVVLVS